jgi:medium-chain acyl-[acyl-carrier-protein] hydrolase
VFCFPHAGGTAAAYRSWWRRLPGDLEVCPIELPGRRARWAEPPRRSCDALAKEIAQAIRASLDRPFVFFGHSLGALVAFEVARELRRSGGPLPGHLFVSARRAPQLAAEGELLHALPDDRLVSEVSKRFRELPAHLAVRPDLLRELVAPLRADLEIHETYRYAKEPPLRCAISALGGTLDPLAPLEQLWAWREQAAGPFVLRMFSGGHFYLQEQEQAVLKTLAEELEEVAAAA